MPPTASDGPSGSGGRRARPWKVEVSSGWPQGASTVRGDGRDCRVISVQMLQDPGWQVLAACQPELGPTPPATGYRMGVPWASDPRLAYRAKDNMGLTGRQETGRGE